MRISYLPQTILRSKMCQVSLVSFIVLRIKRVDISICLRFGSVLMLGPIIQNSVGFLSVFSSLQILKILQHKSIRGLSRVSFELEVIGYTIALAYCLHKGLPFSAYGELAFLLIQGSSPPNNCLMRNSLSLKMHHLFSG